MLMHHHLLAERRVASDNGRVTHDRTVWRGPPMDDHRMMAVGG
jgi:hypothetical protein